MKRYLLALAAVLSCTSASAAQDDRRCDPNADQASNPFVPHFDCPKHRTVRTVCGKTDDGRTICNSVETYE